MVRIFVEVVSSFFAACFLLDHQTRPPSTAKRTTATKSPFGFMLSPLPPRSHSGPNYGEREDHDAQPEEHVDLVGGDGERAIFRRLRPDGDQVLIRGEPVDHISEKVPIAEL